MFLIWLKFRVQREIVGKIPTVCHGPKGEGIHGNTESMEVAELVRAAKVYISTAVNYLGLTYSH